MAWLARAGNVLTKAAFVNLLPPQLVDDTLPIEQVCGLFERFVDQVEIENHNFCNRICWFCPNSFIDRRSQIRLMKNSVFKKIIDALAEIDRARGLRQFRRRTGLNLAPSSKVGYVITGTHLKGTLEIPCYTKEGISTRGSICSPHR